MIKQVKNQIKELGLFPKKSMGQNFLVDEKMVTRIIRRGVQTENSNFLEIGPGLGALTNPLIEMGRPLILMELDPILVKYWRSRGQRVIEGNALKYNWEELSDGDFTLVSNLPYQISSRLVVDLSTSAACIKDMILMFQKEVAQRISARPRTKSYGFLTVIAQSFWCVDRVADLSLKSFYPPPKVSSRVLAFKRLCVEYGDEFVNFVKSGFSQRRKFLVKNLLSIQDLSMMESSKALEEMGLSTNVRAEELSPSQFVELFKKTCG